MVVFPVSEGKLGKKAFPWPPSQVWGAAESPPNPWCQILSIFGFSGAFCHAGTSLGMGDESLGSIPRNWHAFPRRVWGFGGGNAQVGKKKKTPQQGLVRREI